MIGIKTYLIIYKSIFSQGYLRYLHLAPAQKIKSNTKKILTTKQIRMPHRTTHIAQTYNTTTNACGRILRVDDGTGYQI